MRYRVGMHRHHVLLSRRLPYGSFLPLEQLMHTQRSTRNRCQHRRIRAHDRSIWSRAQGFYARLRLCFRTGHFQVPAHQNHATICCAVNVWFVLRSVCRIVARRVVDLSAGISCRCVYQMDNVERETYER